MDATGADARYLPELLVPLRHAEAPAADAARSRLDGYKPRHCYKPPAGGAVSRTAPAWITAMTEVPEAELRPQADLGPQPAERSRSRRRRRDRQGGARAKKERGETAAPAVAAGAPAGGAVSGAAPAGVTAMMRASEAEMRPQADFGPQRARRSRSRRCRRESAPSTWPRLESQATDAQITWRDFLLNLRATHHRCE